MNNVSKGIIVSAIFDGMEIHCRAMTDSVHAEFVRSGKYELLFDLAVAEAVKKFS